PPPELHTLSLHDALPICARYPEHRLQAFGHAADDRDDRAHDLPDRAREQRGARALRADEVLRARRSAARGPRHAVPAKPHEPDEDRKSTRLNSSHVKISY